MYHPLSRVLYVKAVGIVQLAECLPGIQNPCVLFRVPTHKPVLVAHIFNLSGSKKIRNKFKVVLSYYIVSSRPAWDKGDPVFKKRKKKNCALYISLFIVFCFYWVWISETIPEAGKVKLSVFYFKIPKKCWLLLKLEWQHRKSPELKCSTQEVRNRRHPRWTRALAVHRLSRPAQLLLLCWADFLC